MATSKRQRKKEGRRQRLEEQRRAAARAQRRRTLVRMAAVAVVVFAVAALVAALADDDDPETEAVVGDTATTVAEGEPVELTAPPAGATIEGATPCPPAEGAEERVTTFAEPPPLCIDPQADYRAEVVTSKGTVTIDLLEDEAPTTVNNFVVLSRYDFYDGIPFHRVIPGFVVQGGDPEATGAGGPGYEIPDELPEAGAYREGSLAMANSGPDTGGSQFFIVTDGADALEPNYSLFGQVTEGMDVVREIEAVGTPEGPPTEQVTIDEVRIIEG